MRGSKLVLALLALGTVFLSGCIEIIESGGAVFTQGPSSGPFNPALVPKLISLTPNTGIENTTTSFLITGSNLTANADAVVTFGTQQWQGKVNASGSRISDPSGGSFTAPAMPVGSVDVTVTISGMNPPTLTLANAFYYLPVGLPPAPTVIQMSPNATDENGAQTVTFTGTGTTSVGPWEVVCSWQFATGQVDVLATKSATAGEWFCPNPAVPAGESFQNGIIEVTVTCTFNNPAYPVPVTEAVPLDALVGNPFTYSDSGSPTQPNPEEYVIVSGTSAPNVLNVPDSFVRNIDLFDPVYDTLVTQTNLDQKYMFNGSEYFAPSGSHMNPSQIMTNATSWRDSNSTFAHFALPPIPRTYEQAVAAGTGPGPTVTKDVTGTFFHVTEAESAGNPTGTNDAFFAAYSNGEVEYFNTGGGSVHEEIHIHEHVNQFPYFAVCHDNSVQRIFVGRFDGNTFNSSSSNTTELNVSAALAGGAVIKPLSLTMSGTNLYFTTQSATEGRVWKVADIESNAQPVAVAMNWPGGGNPPAVVSDELALSGDGNTICFIGGTGTTRWSGTPGAGPTDTHNVYNILTANTTTLNILPVTDFANTADGIRQVVFWNLADSATSTYGSMNVENGSNDRRVHLAGVNDFDNTTNRAGSDVIVNYDGTLCAFKTREDRSQDGATPAWVVSYLYCARVGNAITNDCCRLNSATTANFGLTGTFYHQDMAAAPGMWFPRTAINGMKDRLIFTVSGAQVGVLGAHQWMFSADINTASMVDTQVLNRTVNAIPTPFNITGGDPGGNYFGGFQSPQGNVLFFLDAENEKLMYLDVRDGVTTLMQEMTRAHDGQPISIRIDNTTAGQNQNTYLPSGFPEDPSQVALLEQWVNQIRTLHNPNLTQFEAQWFYFVAEENAGEEEVYVCELNSLSSSLPGASVNVTNIGGVGVIKAVYPSDHGHVLAVVKGVDGFKESYRYSGSVDGKLYVVTDMISTISINTSGLSDQAVQITTPGAQYSRRMGWYEDASRFSLYFGEGTSVIPTGVPPRSFLRFTRLDLDRTAANTPQAPVQITSIDGNALSDGAIYIYAVGKRE